MGYREAGKEMEKVKADLREMFLPWVKALDWMLKNRTLKWPATGGFIKHKGDKKGTMKTTKEDKYNMWFGTVNFGISGNNRDDIVKKADGLVEYCKENGIGLRCRYGFTEPYEYKTIESIVIPYSVFEEEIKEITNGNNTTT
jgi:hypothetical protein